jgi:hypothetical protein
MKNLWAVISGLAAVTVFGGYGLFYLATLEATSSSKATHMMLRSLDWSSEAFVSFVILAWSAALIGGITMAGIATVVFSGIANHEQSRTTVEGAASKVVAAAA